MVQTATYMPILLLALLADLWDRRRVLLLAQFWMVLISVGLAWLMQVASRHMQFDQTQALGDPRHDRVWQEWTWAKAIHRVAADGISAEQAVDEAIARIKQILAERWPCVGSFQIFSPRPSAWLRSARRPPTSLCCGKRAIIRRRTRRSPR